MQCSSERLVGSLVGWDVWSDWLVVCLVGLFGRIGWLFGWLVVRSLVGWSYELVGWFVWIGWLFAVWLVGRTDWLVGLFGLVNDLVGIVELVEVVRFVEVVGVVGCLVDWIGWF